MSCVPPRSSPRGLRSVLRDAQRVAVRVLEPRDPRTARRLPDPLPVLSHSRVTLEPDAGLLQPLDRVFDIGHLPPEDGVARRGHLLHGRDTQHRAVRVEDEGERAFLDKTQAQLVAIELYGFGHTGGRDERDDVPGAKY